MSVKNSIFYPSYPKSPDAYKKKKKKKKKKSALIV